MRGLIFAAALCCASAPAFATAYVTTQSLPPCTANGSTLIVSRPPTADELAAAVAARGENAPPLLMQRDHLVCDGSAWGLATTVPQYRGG